MSRCKIVLDTPGVLGPGSTLYGRIVCTFSSNQNIREVRCKITGKEHTSIKRGKYTHVGDNVFLYNKLRLKGEAFLSSGQYEFPFQFMFPIDIPSSFDGELGCVSYSLKAVVDVPFGFNYTDKIQLQVSVPIDLNKIRPLLQLDPVIYQSEKTICCWCCASDPLTMSLFLEKEAFILGETAKLVVEITNMSNTNVQEFMITLSRITEYTTNQNDGFELEPFKVKELLVFEKTTGVGAHGQRTFLVNFRIPQSIPLYDLSRCKLIKQHFIIKAEAALPIFHNNFSAYSRVILGHIPLMETHSFQSAYTGIEVEDTPLPDEIINNYDTTAINDVPPPRYSAIYEIEEDDSD